MSTSQKLAVVYAIYLALGIYAIIQFADFQGAQVTEFPASGPISAQYTLPARSPLIVHLELGSPDYLAPEHLFVSLAIPSQNFVQNISLTLTVLGDAPSIYAPDQHLGRGFPHIQYQNPTDHPVTFNVSVVPDAGSPYRIKIIYNFYTDAVTASIIPLAFVLTGMTLIFLVIVVAFLKWFRHPNLLPNRQFAVFSSLSLVLGIFLTYDGIILSDLTNFMDVWGSLSVVLSTLLLTFIAVIAGAWEDLKRRSRRRRFGLKNFPGEQLSPLDLRPEFNKVRWTRNRHQRKILLQKVLQMTTRIDLPMLARTVCLSKKFVLKSALGIGLKLEGTMLLRRPMQDGFLTELKREFNQWGKKIPTEPRIEESKG